MKVPEERHVPSSDALLGASANLGNLPEEILLEITAYCTVHSCIQMIQVGLNRIQCFSDLTFPALPCCHLQTCKGCYSLKDTTSFWKVLLNSVSMLRPVPVVPEQPSLADVRQAVIRSYKLHIKWTIRHDATPSRVYTIGPRRTLATENETVAIRTLVIDDGLHVLQYDSDMNVKLRLVTTGEVVWQWFVNESAMRCLDYTLYQGDIIMIFHVVVDEYHNPSLPASLHPRHTFWMHIWRYKWTGTCEQVISTDMPCSTNIFWSVSGNAICGLYGCCLMRSTTNTTDTTAVYLVNWLEQTLVVVDIATVSPDLFQYLFLSDGRFKARTADVYCRLTSTALLVVFQLGSHALLHSYTISHLRSHMAPIAGTTHAHIQIAPDAVYRIEPEGCSSFNVDMWSDRWFPRLNPIAAGQLRLLFISSYYLMIAPCQLPPPFNTSLSPEEPVTIKCKVTFFSNARTATSRFRRPLWTPENSKKNIAWIYWDTPKDTARTMFDRKRRRRIAFADVGSVHSPPETGEKSGDQESTVGVCFTTEYPACLDKHGDVLSMDMDDVNGRLIMSMEDGALAVMEFV
jgi:hypothetical protein